MAFLAHSVTFVPISWFIARLPIVNLLERQRHHRIDLQYSPGRRNNHGKNYLNQVRWTQSVDLEQCSKIMDPNPSWEDALLLIKVFNTSCTNRDKCSWIMLKSSEKSIKLYLTISLTQISKWKAFSMAIQYICLSWVSLFFYLVQISYNLSS